MKARRLTPLNIIEEGTLKHILLTAAALCLSLAAPQTARAYDPPAESKPLLQHVDLRAATPVDEDYRGEFTRCDATNKFRGHALSGHYRCSEDPSHVEALLRLSDGGVYWESKMALDVDGSWAAWNIPGQTDQKCTSLMWTPVACSKKSTKAAVQAAQINPDQFPFIVMPTDGVKGLTGAAHKQLGAEFAEKTGLQMGDMGVVIYKDRWVPVFIADGGPFMRLGEGSSRLFEELGETRCKKWNADKTFCVGPGRTTINACSSKPSKSAYPYCDFGLSRHVVFVAYPGSKDDALTPDTARDRLCAFAQSKLGLTGSSYCK
jgi:hypothetical protein